MGFKDKIMVHGFREVKCWWEVGEVGKKGGRVMKWQGGKGGRLVRWEGGRFLVLFSRVGNLQGESKILSFVSNVNQGNKGVI